jgi:hypoxanthine phosphoribosyltransferase
MNVIMQNEIETRIKQLAYEIFHDYYIQNHIHTLHLIYVLNGAFIFAADLCRELHRKGMDIIIGAVRVKTYIGTESKIKLPKVTYLYDYDLKDKHILIVEDILDTGNTINYLNRAMKEKVNKAMKAQDPKSIKYCCLLSKSHGRNQLNKNINIDYIGFNIQDIFVVGYGLDYNDRCRAIPYIKKVDE